MGLEATCNCRVDNTSAKANVLLESHELIIRAPFRRIFKVSNLTNVQLVGEELQLRADASVITLGLGAQAAAKWAKKIATPPPCLAQKLGIGHASPAFVIGTIEEPVLLQVLDGHTAGAASAKLSLAAVNDATQLDAALTAHGALRAGSPIWIVHGKGPSARFGETAVRHYMRNRGYRDTKVSAVCATLSATRYSQG